MTSIPLDSNYVHEETLDLYKMIVHDFTGLDCSYDGSSTLYLNNSNVNVGDSNDKGNDSIVICDELISCIASCQGRKCLCSDSDIEQIPFIPNSIKQQHITPRRIIFSIPVECDDYFINSNITVPLLIGDVVNDKKFPFFVKYANQRTLSVNKTDNVKCIEELCMDYL